MITPPDIPAEWVDRVKPLGDEVWVETTENGELRMDTGTTLALPDRTERQQRRETIGIVHAVGDSVRKVSIGDRVRFVQWDIRNQPKERGRRTVTSGLRRFSIIPESNIYARIEEPETSHA